ncbi:SsgA family sporulation/cell division regulator [Kitasatospora sp. NPDC058190]|uniref:SsgA family sporulation/cell division regulator n=1 Tax=Kitasatospora sp. NPDC058190 TaxID=3346371 RepID=UPI0036D9393D
MLTRADTSSRAGPPSALTANVRRKRGSCADIGLAGWRVDAGVGAAGTHRAVRVGAHQEGDRICRSPPSARCPSRFPKLCCPTSRIDAEFPYAACLVFPSAPFGCASGAGLCWHFGRELLNEGRHAPVGNGDVKVRPGPAGEVLITLQGSDGQAVVSAPQDAATGFLADSFTLVPAGSETDHLDVDTVFARLRAGG